MRLSEVGSKSGEAFGLVVFDGPIQLAELGFAPFEGVGLVGCLEGGDARVDGGDGVDGGVGVGRHGYGGEGGR